MWQGHEEALGRYGLTCCEVWTELGFGDTCAATIATDLRAAGVATIRTQAELADAGALPPWLGDEALHRSHRSALVRKDPEHYGPAVPGRPGRPALRLAGALRGGPGGRTSTCRDQGPARRAGAGEATAGGRAAAPRPQPRGQEGVGHATAQRGRCLRTR